MGELDTTYGATLIGVCASAILYGITNLQVYIYFRAYPQDELWNKISVCWLWGLDSLHLAFCIYMMYWYLITNFCVVAELGCFNIQTFFASKAFVILSVDTLYTFRVWKLDATAHNFRGWRRLRPVSMVISIALCAGFESCNTVLCYEIMQMDQFSRPCDHNTWRWITYYPVGTATCIDILIAASLCHLLSRHRTGFRKTDSLINWLMFYTLNTGLVTRSLAVFPETFLVITFEFLMVKCMCCSYLTYVALIPSHSIREFISRYAQRPQFTTHTGR
ncbi:uncharacterized protein B0H18DRAFT_982569 [Fomitopsis serialis]|uniref:uncharacterized protein n=1 Tax=Fomitopsis serialis TaxID=139415 RepID=UPI002008C81C|nr:uncharacterized protein B0H18DRAFT_982569 [Neoantrodia serialis]KAH9933893.1 hypothetical protein B0H18DRAFT_982569 [Neoantrodia serialis]